MPVLIFDVLAVKRDGSKLWCGSAYDKEEAKRMAVKLCIATHSEFIVFNVVAGSQFKVSYAH